MPRSIDSFRNSNNEGRPRNHRLSTIGLFVGAVLSLCYLTSCNNDSAAPVPKLDPTMTALEMIMSKCDFVAGGEAYMAKGNGGISELLKCAWTKSFLKDDLKRTSFTEGQIEEIMKAGVDNGELDDYFPNKTVTITYKDENSGVNTYVYLKDVFSVDKFFEENPNFRKGKETTLIIGDEQTKRADGLTIWYSWKWDGSEDGKYFRITEYNDGSQEKLVEEWK